MTYDAGPTLSQHCYIVFLFLSPKLRLMTATKYIVSNTVSHAIYPTSIGNSGERTSIPIVEVEKCKKLI